MNRRRNRNGRAIQRPSNRRGIMRRTNRTSKDVSSSTPYRIPTSDTIVSIPAHNFGLKISKTFRIDSQRASSGFPLSMGTLLANMQAELGLPATTTAVSDSFTVYGFTIYGVGATGATLSVIVNFANTPGATPTVLANFTDSCSTAGVCCIKFRYPVGYRPTWYTGAQGTIQCIALAPGDLALNETMIVTIDCDAIFQRTPVAPIT
jgi:hypothetical protein